MKTSITTLVLAGTIVTSPMLHAETIDSRLGKIEVENGYPTKVTTEKLYNELDFQRACQTYMWALRAVWINELQLANKRDWGIDFNTVGICNNYTDPSVVALTGNNTTIYAVVFVDLSKDGAGSHRLTGGCLRRYR